MVMGTLQAVGDVVESGLQAESIAATPMQMEIRNVVRMCALSEGRRLKAEG
jgi:hypothetical protein